MFNLEKSIKRWHKQLRKNQSLEDGCIEELEAHLRDEIEKEISLGLSEEEAFTKAKEFIGNTEKLAGEYFKSDAKSVSGKPSWEAPFWMPELVWNYFKTALRNIRKHKGYSLINITGLSLGIACVILISMVINYELSFDNFHEKKDRIYRVYTRLNRSSGTSAMAPVMFPFAPAVKEIPEIEKAVRICQTTKSVSFNEKIFFERIFYSDPGILDVFSIDLKEGNKNTALINPNSLIISEKMASKYFGDKEAVGQSIKIDNKTLFNITGVFYDIPSNSHFNTGIIASVSSLNENNFQRYSKWTSFGNEYTYLLLRNGAQPQIVEEKIEKVTDKNLDEESRPRYEMRIQPLSDVHFTDFLMYDNAKVTPVEYLYVFGAIAVFILIIACINFINLSTARSARRNKEIGIRKVIGAGRFQLVKQFLSESFILTLISLTISLALVYAAIPEVNSLVKTGMSFSILLNWKFLTIIFVMLIFTSIAAGGYPAFILSSVKPAVVLKNSLIKSNKGYSLRSLLVIIQFAISSFLIISTFTVFSQINYLVNKDLGINKDEIIVIPIDDDKLWENPQSLKNSLLSNSSISNLTFSSGSPASGSTMTENAAQKGKEGDGRLQVRVLIVDYNFFDTFGIEFEQGRNFSKEFITDENKSVIINQTAANKLGMGTPIGKQIEFGGDGDKELSIIGVIKDFHYSSLKEKIWPTILILNPAGNRYLSVKINTENAAETIDYIKENTARFSPGYPFEFYFMNEEFEKFYNNEKTIGKLLTYSTFFAVLISCIGVLGLVSFLTEQKSKEIGVRKVLGASVGSIVTILSKQFIKWVITANLIIMPAAYYFSNKWLDSFAYRAKIGFYIFLGTIVISMLITLLTVGYHSIKAALANPVRALKYE
ncbi:MAG: ABC transporter permease [Ignavibacteria bacterium]|jgi:putative ABC transport system permease protein